MDTAGASGATPPPARSVAEQELINSLGWLIRMRWLAAGAVLAGTAITAHVIGLPVPERAAYAIGVSIFAYNLLFWFTHGRLDALCPHFPAACQWFARVQIGFDWLAMSALIALSGGIESPAIVFFLFHITIASLLLPHDKGFLYVTLAPILVAGIAVLEARGILHHVSLFNPPRYSNPLYVVGVLVFFTSASYVMAYLAMSISRRLRRREGEISGLYESVRAATSTLELSAVLDRLSEATARVLGCQGAAIRLLDPTGRQLVAAASYGLSESFMAAVLDLERSAIDREALAENKALFIDGVNDPRIVYPEANRQEGIRTILVAPLVGRSAPIGVLRAYGAEGHEFDRDDANFLLAVAAQGAIAIENAQAYEMLARLDRDKSQFVRTVTHELRSPVQVSQNLLALLDQGYVGQLTPEQKDLVTRARRRIEFLQTLVDDLLDLAAGKAGLQPRKEPEEVDLPPVVRDVCARFAAAAHSKGLQLRVEVEAAAVAVVGDAGEIDRMLNNLVGNAIRYTPHGQVAVQLTREGDVARITVSDTGIGIPADALSHLFEEFFRAANAKAIEEHGTGLGLAIVKGLVERYRGTISVDSREGRGTTFVVRLPLVAAGADPVVTT
jgi:signal transduction histidine kinase